MPFVHVLTSAAAPQDLGAFLQRVREAVSAVKGDPVDMIAVALQAGAALGGRAPRPSSR